MGTLALEDLLYPHLRRYLDAPGWLRVPAGRLYRWIPRRLRLGAEYARFEEEAAARGDPRALSRRARDKLGATLAWALHTVPAYEPFAGLLAAHADPRRVLAALPVTDKLDIKRHPDRYLSRAMPAGARLTTYTGGSTQHPMRFHLEKHVTRVKEHAYAEDFRRRAGMGEGEPVLALRGRAIPGAPDNGLWSIEPIKGHLALSCEHLERRYMPAYMEALAAWRPRFIEAFPSALYPLARWLEAHPLPEFTRGVKGVMLFSENAYGFQLEAFKRVFDCPILCHYGHSERVLAAATMPDDERSFFWPLYGHFELLDAENRPVTRPGKLGFVVGTSFDNRVMPFVRYRTGDMAMLSDRPHPFLDGFPVCERIVGRMQEFIVCRDHRLVSVTAVGVAHFEEMADVDAIQYEQRQAGQLVVKVAACRRLEAADRERIGAAVARRLQDGCEVEVVQVESIPRTLRGKARLLVQHLDLQRLLGTPEPTWE